MTGVDIGNSVPYIANKIFFDPESARQFYPKPEKYPIMMLKCLRLTDQQDVKRYSLITSKAKFYRYLVTEFNKRGCHYEIVTEKGKKKFKAKVFQVLFSSNKYNCREKRIFHELFPGVSKAASVLRMFNRNYFNYMLGRMEAYIVLDVILYYLNTNYPELSATQIYDNVISSVNGGDIVNQLMTEKLTEFIGVPPTLKIENFLTERTFLPNNLQLAKNTISKRKRLCISEEYSHTNLKPL